MNTESVLVQYKKVINYEVMRVLHQHEDCWQDAIQETFLRVHNSIDSILSKKGKYQENYIRVIARNAAKTILSKELLHRERNTSYEEWLDTNPEEGIGFFVEEPLDEGMEECLRQLSEEEKDFLFLRFVEELEYEEISAAMDMSEAACRQRVSRAKKHLESVIEETDAGKNLVRGRVRYGHE